MQQIGLSVVVPVYSGEAYLERLVERIAAFREGWETADSRVRVAELIMVDDGAIDGSEALIDRLASEHDWIVPLHLSRNFGQHAATIAGILHSSGDWVATLDEDLQHPPERIEDLLREAVIHSADVVYGKPLSQAVHGKQWRDGSSRIVKRIMEWLTENPTLTMVNSFRVMRGPVARAAASVCTHNTFFDVALYWFTDRIKALPLELSDHRFKTHGESGYTFRKLALHAQRMLFSSQIRLLAVGTWIGLALFLGSFIAAIFLLLLRIFYPETIGVQGWTSLILAICLAAGMLAIMIGICLEYLSTLVLKAHGRPTFFTIDRSGDAALDEWFSALGEQAETEKTP